MTSSTCKGCGSSFAPRSSGGKRQVWCSRQCAYEERCATVRIKVCSECQERFETHLSYKKTCSLSCQAARKLRIKRLAYVSNDPRRQQMIAQIDAARRRRKAAEESGQEIAPVLRCTVCQGRFVRRQWQQLTCSPKCSAVHRRQHEMQWRRARAAALRKRKAELRKKQRQALAEGIIKRECCPWCGDDFDALDEAERYCSEECQMEDAAERHRQERL